MFRNDDFIIRSTIPDIVVPKMRFVDKLWADSATYKNLVALVSVFNIYLPL